jgi:steroid delta-isomerase-like uncharacterized protein
MAVDQSTAEANRERARRIVEELWNGRDTTNAGELIAEDVVDHNLGPGEFGGLDGFKEHHAEFMRGSSDLHIQLEDTVAEGDKVVVRLTWRGTHDGTMFGIPPTGKSITVTNITIYRFRDGKLVDVWRNQDTLGMLEQMGVAPPAGMGPIRIVGFVIGNVFRMGSREFRRKLSRSG